MAVEPPSAATSSPLGCVLERSRRLCLNLYRKEMLTADSAVESALKWVERGERPEREEDQ